MMIIYIIKQALAETDVLNKTHNTTHTNTITQTNKTINNTRTPPYIYINKHNNNDKHIQTQQLNTYKQKQT